MRVTMSDSDFRTDLAAVLNKHSRENGSNTPDFLLAEFLHDVLDAFDDTVKQRAKWYGRLDTPGAP